MKNVFFALLTLFTSISIFAQNQTATGRDGDTKKLVPQWDTAFAHGGDTLYYSLPAVTIYSKLRTFANPRDQKRYNKLLYHVKKVYPYAKRAGEVLKEEEKNMVGLGRSDRKDHMKQVEKRIEKQFGKELRDLTFTQGRILLKLIDRETGYTSYQLVDDLRGTFRAWFYDGIAGLFGYDLKGEYDPKKNLEDRYIEEIVLMIESGQIALE